MYTTKAGERRFQVAAPVSEKVYEELRRLAYERRTTVSAQVRQAVSEYVDRAPAVVHPFTKAIEPGQLPADR
jgi:predicted transcriptional regulator